MNKIVRSLCYLITILIALNRSKLHLNEAGTKVFAKNIINCTIDFSSEQIVSDSSQVIERSLIVNLCPEVQKPLDNSINHYTSR